MPTATNGPIRIEYETFGEGQPVLLIMGIGAQLILWREGFCQMLADHGFQVIRFDNRDVGLSSKLDHLGTPSMTSIGWHIARRKRFDAAYTLTDMAGDAAAVLDAVGAARAHVVGASMGGMIAQTMACTHPDRLLSLTSIMSSTGQRKVSWGSPKAIMALLKAAPRDRKAAQDGGVALFRAIGSPGYPLDEAEVRELAGQGWDRCHHPAGFMRQLAAILASGNRTRHLGGITAPTLVIHGEGDPLIPVAGARATAEAIPGARLVTFPGMGHDLPRELWPAITDLIAEHARNTRRNADSREQ